LEGLRVNCVRDAALTWLSFSSGCIQDPPQFAADALFATLTASDAALPRSAAPARPRGYGTRLRPSRTLNPAHHRAMGALSRVGSARRSRGPSHFGFSANSTGETVCGQRKPLRLSRSKEAGRQRGSPRPRQAGHRASRRFRRATRLVAHSGIGRDRPP
jgi:hypothetical protein